MFYKPGQEPEYIKKYVDYLRKDLQKSFPDGTIIADMWNHEKWDNIINYITKRLDFPDALTFLEEYGYQVFGDLNTNEQSKISSKPAKKAEEYGISNTNAQRSSDIRPVRKSETRSERKSEYIPERKSEARALTPMARCRECGTEIKSSYKFCKNCGAQVSTTSYSEPNIRTIIEKSTKSQSAAAPVASASSEKISDKWIWALATIPMFASIFLPSLFQKWGINPLYATGIVILLNIIFIFCDVKELKDAGEDAGSWLYLGFILVPIYLFVRESKTNKNYIPGIIWCVLFTLSLFIGSKGVNTEIPDFISINNGNNTATISSTADPSNASVTAKPNAVQNNTSSFGTASSNTVAAKKEINPDIPIGTTYELSQGEYECGDDFPAGRYKIEWLSGNQFGGYINTIKGCKQIGDQLSVNTDYPCFFEFENGDQFEVSLINIRLTKIPSVKNEYFKENDGSYVFGDGYYQGEVDIPSGKYNVTAINGNQFGIYVTVNGDMKSLDQGETYNNLTIKDAATIEVSLGQARFTPKG